MCGIVGYIGPKKVLPVVIEGLRKLEYRGYDSAGIAVVDSAGKLEIRRASGKLRNLEEVIAKSPIEGTYGIGHTRWATHGRATEENAHPHRDCTGKIVVVHNGIIENYLELKEQLQREGHKFVTETDTEIVAHLVEKNSKNAPLEEAVRRSLKELRGIYSLVFLSAKDPHKIVAARMGPPSVIGLGDGEYFVASDIPALLEHTREIFFLADGDIAVLTSKGVCVMDHDGRPVSRPAQHVAWDPIMAEKGGFKHFMQKEIFEQPRAVRDTLLGRISQDTGKIFLDDMQIAEQQFRDFQQVRIVACGTILTHAGPEIGVASTTAFTSQLTALLLLAAHLGQVRGRLTSEAAKTLLQEFTRIPHKIETVLQADETGLYENLARQFFRNTDFLYLGRGIHYPIALEGALKLKEISYIHAEGYPAGEMKHGPNALIDENLPVVVLATHDER